jgi:hypothetical protein
MKHLSEAFRIRPGLTHIQFLMYVGKARAYPNEAPFIGFPHYTTLKRLARDNHSSLLLTLVNYGCKKFYNMVTWFCWIAVEKRLAARYRLRSTLEAWSRSSGGSNCLEPPSINFEKLFLQILKEFFSFVIDGERISARVDMVNCSVSS